MLNKLRCHPTSNFHPIRLLDGFLIEIHIYLITNSTDPDLLASSEEEFVCVEVLRPSQPNGVMSSAVSLPNHTFTGQA